MKMKMLVAQSCPTLCDPVDCNLPGSSVRGILQARMLEWVAIPFSRGSSQARDPTWVSCMAGEFFTVYATREAIPLSNSLYSFNFSPFDKKLIWHIFIPVFFLRTLFEYLIF